MSARRSIAFWKASRVFSRAGDVTPRWAMTSFFMCSTTTRKTISARLYLCGLVKCAQMQGARHPEERGVLWAYGERRGTRATPQMGAFHQTAHSPADHD